MVEALKIKTNAVKRRARGTERCCLLRVLVKRVQTLKLKQLTQLEKEIISSIIDGETQRIMS